MLTLKEAEFLEEWKERRIIEMLTLENTVFLKKEVSADVRCSDGRQSYEYIEEHWHANPQNDHNGWYGGPAVFAKSYKGYNEIGAILRVENLVEGITARGINSLILWWHLPCGMLTSYRHKPEEIITLAVEAEIFLRSRMKDVEIHQCLNIRRESKKAGVHQSHRIFCFNPWAGIKNSFSNVGLLEQSNGTY